MLNSYFSFLFFFFVVVCMVSLFLHNKTFKLSYFLNLLFLFILLFIFIYLLFVFVKTFFFNSLSSDLSYCFFI